MNWYWNGNSDTDWHNVANWWDGANATGSHPADAPWTTAATKDDNLFEAGSTVYGMPIVSASLGNGFAITGHCSIGTVNAVSGADFMGGTFSGNVVGVDTRISGGQYDGSITLTGITSISEGIFNCVVDMPAFVFVSGGTFNAAVTVSTEGCGISTATFNSTVDVTGISSNIYSGIFHGIVTLGGVYPAPTIQGGTFNNTVSITTAPPSRNITGAIFNALLTDNGSGFATLLNCTLNGTLFWSQGQLGYNTMTNLKSVSLYGSAMLGGSSGGGGINGSGILGMV